MPTAPDGILTADYDPALNIVLLTTDGDEWPATVETVTVYRTVGGTTTPVRGAQDRPAPDGVLIWSDNECPMDVSATYACEGYDGSTLVATSTVTVSTTGAEPGMWAKVPGNASLNIRLALVDVADQVRPTLGGTYQIPGGVAVSQSATGALAQSAGMGALTTSIVLQADTVAQRAALEQVVASAPGQVVLLQEGLDEELPSGYYQVGELRRLSSGARVRTTVYPMRRLALPLTESIMPAGSSTGYTGVTYDDVLADFATYQALEDGPPATYLDLARGEWS